MKNDGDIMGLTYLVINFLIILFPLLFSFRHEIKYYKNFKELLISIILTGAFFVTWDSIATKRGDWWFSSAHTLGMALINLPIEEILFFITVPFSCLFVFESLNYFIKEQKVDKNLTTIKITFYLLGTIIIISSFLFTHLAYTFTVLFVTGATIILVNKFTKVFELKNYYYFILLTLGLFIIFNYILTSIPVVNYNPLAITKIRLITIPIEDFFYNFSLLTIYLSIYLKFKKVK